MRTSLIFRANGERRPEKELCPEAQAIRDVGDADTKEFFEKLQQKIVAVWPNRNVTDTKAAELRMMAERRNLNSGQKAACAAEAQDLMDQIAGAQPKGGRPKADEKPVQKIEHVVMERKTDHKLAETLKQTHAGVSGKKLPQTESDPDKNKTATKLAE